MSACEQMDARVEQYNTNFDATRAYVRVALFRPDTNALSMLVNSGTHLHYLSQKQWLPGIRGETGTTAQNPSRCSDVLP